MRRFTPLVLLAVLAAALAPGAARAGDLPASGFLVFKDMEHGPGVVEVRDDATGRIVDTIKPELGGSRENPCTDPHFKTYSRWRKPPTYLINPATVPATLDAVLARAELVRAQEAWEKKFTTDCKAPGRSEFKANDGGDTDALPTLVTDLADDGQNTVGWVPLAGTVCEGALACVVADYTGSKIKEADLALASDLDAGFSWTTSPTTDYDDVSGVFAISDVATHEFGHFAGLNHVEKSPLLTMYPFIDDGDDTLGLGDMKGILSLY